jgi:TrmH family RNA methyltransferase
MNQMQKEISSRENPTFKNLVQLLQSRGIKKQQQFLLFGEKVVSETLADSPQMIAALLRTAQMSSPSARPRGIEEFVLANELFSELDIFGTHQPILLCHTPEIQEWTPQAGLNLFLALGDPANLGAVLRSAAAFGCAQITLLKECASPFHPRAVRAASGTLLKTPLRFGPSVHELNLQKTLHAVVALDMHGQPIAEFKWPKDVNLILGEEGPGLPAHLKAQLISIPIAANVESLNATVAASLAMYSYRQQNPL